MITKKTKLQGKRTSLDVLSLEIRFKAVIFRDEVGESGFHLTGEAGGHPARDNKIIIIINLRDRAHSEESNVCFYLSALRASFLAFFCSIFAAFFNFIFPE
jgi:hypothetical protein